MEQILLEKLKLYTKKLNRNTNWHHENRIDKIITKY